jgi:SPP1 gp7 family putative phage head morphogenesis protein
MTDATRISDLQRETDAFRQRLINMDRQASQVLGAAYADTLKALQPRLDALESQIAARIASGEPFSQAWLFQQARYRELIRQTDVLIDQYGAATKAVTTAAQQAAVRGSFVEAGQMLLPISGGSDELAQLVAGWASVPDSTIQRMVGALQESTPLGQLFAGYGDDAVKDVNRALIRGAALGLGARETARAVQSALNISRARSETIVRTETLRASNAALLAAFQASGVVSGWRWSASLSLRTCAACLSRHGKVYPLSKAMDRHVNCRCSMSPYLGNGDDVEWETGEKWLKRQPNAVQDNILGKEGGSLFRSGDVLLSDFERVTQSSVWGDSVGDGGVRWAKSQAEKRTSIPRALAEPFADWQDGLRFRRTLDAKYTKREIEVLQQYRSQRYSTLNTTLRQQGVTSDIRNEVSAIDSAMAKVTLPQDIGVWRGTGIDAFGVSSVDDLSRLRGTIIQDNGYVSTSLNKSTANSFYGLYSGADESAMVQIHVPAGTKVIPQNNATGRRTKREEDQGETGEEEFILPRGSSFEVVDVATTRLFGIGDVPLIILRLL